MSHEYIRFIEVLKGLSSKDGSTIDPEAKLLLDEIAIQHFKNTPLTVSDLMALKHIASPATIHRKLDMLRELGLINQIFQGDNRRTKYLVTTSVADDYFDTLGRVLIEAVATEAGV